MWRKPVPFFAFVAVLAMLASCRSVENKSLDKTQVAPIRTIALLGVRESRAIRVFDFSGYAGLGSPIAAAVSADTDNKRSEQFVAEYNRGTAKLSSLIVNGLRDDLAKSGTEVSYLPREFAALKDAAADYSLISTDADVILDVWYGAIGYVQARFSTTYQPWMMINARAVSSKTKETLYRKTFSAGYETIVANTVFVPCSTAIRYDSFDALMQNHGKAVEALADCQKTVVQRIAADLKQGD